MSIFLASVIVFGLALVAMAVGVLAGRQPPRGSCGGIGGRCESTGEPVCDLCRPEDSSEYSRVA